MASSVQNPEDLCNLSLVRIGFQGRIDNIYDGSRQSNAALNVYSQTRDELLRDGDWGFAERNEALTLLKQAPAGGYGVTQWTSTYPPIPWTFEYSYPSSCLRVRSVRATPIFQVEYTPQYNRFIIVNDNTLVTPAKVILTNVEAAIAVFSAQITDPSLWEPLFIESFAASLGRRLAAALTNLETEKLEGADEAVETTKAKMQVG